MSRIKRPSMIADSNQEYFPEMSVQCFQEEADTRFEGVRQTKPLPLQLIL
jgi:hypothetical protein